MDWAGDSAEQLTATLDSEGSEEEEEEDEDEDEDEEEAAVVQEPLSLGRELGDTEQWLLELEQVSQVLLAELSALETEFETERTCRQRAEAYAAQVKQENQELKRLSLAPLAPPALPQEQPPQEQPPEGDPDPHSGQQLQDLQEQLSGMLEQRHDLTSQVQELQKQNQDLQDQVVTQELEQEQDPRLHAEAFTHERQELDVARAALAAAQEEKLELRKRLEEAEGRLRALREEVMLLWKKVAKDLSPQSQSHEVAVPVPPPPPPLPPPAVPVDPLSALRQRRGLASPQRSRAGGDDAKARAVQEMMQRIRAGVVLRPAKERVSPRQEARRSAVLELQSILGAIRTGRGRGRRQSGAQRGEQRLQNRLRHPAADGAPPLSPPGSQQGPHPGDKDISTVPLPGSGDSSPFRARVTGGLPRTRPLARRAGDRGEPG
ncbi:proline-, glutamic acid- and leucine-rich protein 1-like [Patagioenas fasciata monilis]|uniref:Proline-, glutamic acid-and leucine-rich protein 1-like n=1 Tax=Patagioenas fasciata monilis TaxID=372326 RepID=A0A1V4KTP0_PATFA|nr:proline-, glutamic acid- and leucine-rich protein 1-like [Patagioenas fasciata monilis]